MKHEVDRRQIVYERDDEAVARLEELRGPWLDLMIELARLFMRVDSKAFFIAFSCSSIAQFGSLRKFDGAMARDLAYLGYALEGEPELEAMLRDGRVLYATACELGRVYERKELIEPEDDWLQWAWIEPHNKVRRRIRERLEAGRQRVDKAKVTTYSAAVTEDTRNDLEHCREVATRKANKPLSKGQTLAILSKSYLLGQDPTYTPTRARRMPPTDENLYDRGVASDVVKAILERSGGKCEFGACGRVMQQFCHLSPHADGSPREAQDLVGGCSLHHKAYDLGWIRFLRHSQDGQPVFYCEQTHEFLIPLGPPDARELDDLPEWMSRAMEPRLRRRYEALLKQERAKQALEDPPEGARAEAEPPPKTREQPPPDDMGQVCDRGPAPAYRRQTPTGRGMGKERAPPGARDDEAH